MSLPLQAINPNTGKARVAIYLQDAHRIREGMEFTQYAESKGFEAVWQAESRLVREATVPMAAFASVTNTVPSCASAMPRGIESDPTPSGPSFVPLDPGMPA